MHARIHSLFNVMRYLGERIQENGLEGHAARILQTKMYAKP
jgi:hypothetical protein